MTGLLADAPALARRAALARGAGAPFAPLAASLAGDLDAVLRAGVHVAERKARLTRAGGRCPVHGAEFDFDPYAPDRFRCRACGRDYAGDEHREFWLYRYQLWLAERAVHAAALHAAAGRADHAAFAARVLGEAADAYPRLPNRDNVLGPSRPFFSTYIESLWLLSLCVALDLLESAGADLGALGGRVRDRLVAPSRALVASYPEGRSNRQVWNAAALLAAARLLGDGAGAERAVHGPGGVAAALRDGLLADGTWYEGDNYHQFAHRGLWYGVTMAARAGLAPDAALVARFDRGFAAPFLVAMPGLTLPARRDAQFGASLRQWRWAEWLELGLARAARDPDAAGDPRALAGWLRTLYTPTGRGAGGTGRWRAAGEAERNEPAADLTRADLGWKSLLFARPTLPDAGRAAPSASVLLAEQGLAILRPAADADGPDRDGPDPDGPGAYVSLDYGPPGGGHGHPDRLNVQLPPWRVDPGTGSYVDRTLHWYRSTLAHAAPLVDERSQPPTAGRLLGFDAGREVQGAAAEAAIAPGVLARRWLVLAPGYLVDRLAWRGLGARTLDLSLGGAVGDARPALRWRPAARPGAGGLEDGFDFLGDADEAPLDAGGARLVVGARELADAHDGDAAVWVHAPPGALLWRAVAPGAPGHGPGSMCVVRAAGDAGAITVVWDLSGGVETVAVRPDGSIAVAAARGGRDVHRPPVDDGDPWRIHRERPDRPPRDVHLALGGVYAPALPDPADAPSAPTPAPEPDLAPDVAAPLAFELGEAHYRRSEESWTEAGRPTARVTLAVGDDRLHLTVAVRLGRPTTFVPPGTDNPLDNERAAINGDGVQLHLGVARGGEVESVGAWLLVPVVPGPAVDVTRTTAPDPTADAATPACAWNAAPGGWTLACSLPLAPLRARAAALGVAPVVALDLLVNEMPPGRERRRGQLVLSGGGAGGGEAFVYLRGDRHDLARALRLRLPPAP